MYSQSAKGDWMRLLSYSDGKMKEADLQGPQGFYIHKRKGQCDTNYLEAQSSAMTQFWNQYSDSIVVWRTIVLWNEWNRVSTIRILGTHWSTEFCAFSS